MHIHELHKARSRNLLPIMGVVFTAFLIIGLAMPVLHFIAPGPGHSARS